MSMRERVIRYSSTAGQLMSTEYDWEKWYGDSGERAILSGKIGISYRKYYAEELEKQRIEIQSGYRPKRTAKQERRSEYIADKKRKEEVGVWVAQLGKQAFKLRGAVEKFEPLPKSVAKAILKKYRNKPPPDLLDECEQAVDDEECEPKREDDESSCSSDDEDWDTTDWTRNQVQGSVDTLLVEIRSSSSAKKRKVATWMLTRLLKKHSAAVDHMDLIIPAILEKALFVANPDTPRSTEAVRLGHLLGVVGKFIPERLSRYACAKKSSRLLAQKFSLASRIIQSRWRWFYFEKNLAKTLTAQHRCQRRGLFMIQYSSLLRTWRRAYVQNIGRLSLSENMSQIKLLQALCGPKNVAFGLKDRGIAVEQGVLYPLLQFGTHQLPEVRHSALGLLATLAKEPSLRLPMLQCGVTSTLGILMLSGLVEDRCKALEVLDILSGSVCYIEPKLLRQVWNKFYDQETIDREKKEEVKKFGQLEKIKPMSVYLRAQRPELCAYDSVKIFADRRRDGGLLRWLRHLVESEEGLVRLGATMCILKLASSSCNPFLVCVGEKKTLLEIREEEEIKKWEKKERRAANRQAAGMIVEEQQQYPETNSLLPTALPSYHPPPSVGGSGVFDRANYEDRRQWRAKQFVHTLTYNLSCLDIPGLSIASLKVLTQLTASPASRQVLLDSGLPELISMNFFFENQESEKEFVMPKEKIRRVAMLTRGLLLLVALSSNSTWHVPIHEGDLAEDDSSGNNILDTDNLHSPYLSILDLDIFASEQDLHACLQASLLSMISQSPEHLAESSIERFCFEYRGLAPLYKFLFANLQDLDSESTEVSTDPEELKKNGKVLEIEQQCVTALVMARFCRVCPRIASDLCHEHVVCAIANVLVTASESDYSNVPDAVVRLVKTSAEASCFALTSIARDIQNPGSRWIVSSILKEKAYIQHLVRLVGFGIHGSEGGGATHQLDSLTAVRAATLIGAILPWMGFQIEAVTDLVSESNTALYEIEEEKQNDKGKRKQWSTPEEQELYYLQQRGTANARKAAEEGIQGIGCFDVKSEFTTAGASSLVNDIIELAGKRLVRFVLRCDLVHDIAVIKAICYTISRMSSTYATSARMLQFGTVGVVTKLLPLTGKHVKAHKAQYLDRLGNIPSTVFTLCANLARNMEGKHQMIACGAVWQAANAVCFLNGGNVETAKLRGEAALLLARVANVSHPIHGASNEIMLKSQSGEVFFPALLTFAGQSKNPIRARHHALLCISQLCQDEYQAVPMLSRNSGVRQVVDILREVETHYFSLVTSSESKAVDNKNCSVDQVSALLRELLRIVYALANFLLAEHHDALIQAGIEPVLQRLSLKQGSSKTMKIDSRLAKQLGVHDFGNVILEKLRISIAHGSDAYRAIATAPTGDERPLTSGYIESNTDNAIMLKDPFGTRAKPTMYYYPQVNGLRLPPCTAKGRLEPSSKRSGNQHFPRLGKDVPDKQHTGIHTPSRSRCHSRKKRTPGKSASRFRHPSATVNPDASIMSGLLNAESSLMSTSATEEQSADLLWTRPPGKPKRIGEAELEASLIALTRPPGKPFN